MKLRNKRYYITALQEPFDVFHWSSEFQMTWRCQACSRVEQIFVCIEAAHLRLTTLRSSCKIECLFS